MKYKIGACYHPPYYSEEKWGKDVKKIRKIGLNFTRTGELIASWEWMESREGEIDWSWMDRYIELCGSNNVKVILGVGTAGTPLWLYNKLKALGDDIRVINNYGQPYPLEAGWGWACPDHENYLKILKEHIIKVVERYKDHPSVFGWQVSNELSYPFIEREGNETPDLFCYCPETIEAFREWLMNKYDSLVELSQAWMWTPTNIQFGDWEEVEPPRAKPFEYGNFGGWLDWREFSLERMEKFLKWQNDIVKSLSGKPTMVNLFYLHNTDPFGVITAMSPYRAVAHVDVLGVDVYPGDRQYREREYCSIHLNMGKDDAERKGKDFWVPELQSGPIYGFIEGPFGEGSGDEIVRYLSEAVAHGSKLTLFMGWKDYPSLPLYWGGIVEMDGEQTERSEKVKKRLSEFSQWPEDKFEPCKPTVGIFIDERNEILLTGMNEQQLLREAVQGAYRLFFDEKIPIRFIRKEDFINSNLHGIELIVFPLTTAVDAILLKDIKKFVLEGGSIFVTPQFGFFKKGIYRRLNMNRELLDLLGSRTGSIIGNKNPEIYFTNGMFKGAIHKEVINVIRKAEVLGAYADNMPAIVLSKLGKGNIVRFGTHYDIAYYHNDDKNIQDIISRILNRLEITRPFKIKNNGNIHREKFNLLDIHLLKGRKYSVINMINYSNQDIDGKLVISKVQWERSIGDGEVYLVDNNICFRVAGGRVFDILLKNNNI